jgi:DNA-binding PadR family transcriptional regulator
MAREYLGEFEHLLLLAVMQLPPEDAYGNRIRTAIEERTGRGVAPGAIYTALARLEGRGLVRSWLGEPTPQRGGKRKRHYQLEPAGAALLKRMQDVLARMSSGLEFRPEGS